MRTHLSIVCLLSRLEAEELRRQEVQSPSLFSSYLVTDCPLGMLERVEQGKKHMLQLVIHRAWRVEHLLNMAQLAAPALLLSCQDGDRGKAR